MLVRRQRIICHVIIQL